jgi:hypothetical protein
MDTSDFAGIVLKDSSNGCSCIHPDEDRDILPEQLTVTPGFAIDWLERK